jgi:hypothetical protein
VELAAGVGFVEAAGGIEDDGERGFDVERHLEELLAEEGEVDESLPEGGAAAGVDDGFEEGAAHHGGGPHAVREAGDVDHLGHLGEAVVNLADDVADCALELVLAGRHGAGAEFVLSR